MPLSQPERSRSASPARRMAGMLRFAEAAMQVMGRAGDHQVDGARTALGHAYGGGSQFFSMWVVSDTAPASA